MPGVKVRVRSWVTQVMNAVQNDSSGPATKTSYCSSCRCDKSKIGSIGKKVDERTVPLMCWILPGCPSWLGCSHMTSCHRL